MALTPDQITLMAKPIINQIIGYGYIAIQIGAVFLVLFYITMILMFNVQVITCEYTKGGRTIIKFRKAREIKNKKTGIPNLQFRHFSLFFGDRINSAPNECSYPLKSYFAKKCFMFILKDGVYYPVNNMVLGKKYKIEREGGIIEEIYSTEDTGLEISRDFDSEQSIINKLQECAINYRNKKPIEIVAMYGLMVIVIISASVIIVYSLKRVGDLFETLQVLSGPIQSAVENSLSQRLGP